MRPGGACSYHHSLLGLKLRLLQPADYIPQGFNRTSFMAIARYPVSGFMDV
jgi:hypothetical protein